MIALFGSAPPNQRRIYAAIGPACNYKNKRDLSRKPAWRCWLCPYCAVRSACRTAPPFCRARGNSFICLFAAIFFSLRKYRYRLDSTMIRKGSCIWSLFEAFSRPTQARFFPALSFSLWMMSHISTWTCLWPRR